MRLRSYSYWSYPILTQVGTMRLHKFLRKVLITRRVRRRPRKSAQYAHYRTHKELARETILPRLAHWNTLYGHEYKRVAIRNQVSRWGSCSTKGNLNFNYRLIFLPQHLMDYVLVHELCHLKHFNHGEEFWMLVSTCIPNYEACKRELQIISKHMYHPGTLPETAESRV